MARREKHNKRYTLQLGRAPGTTLMLCNVQCIYMYMYVDVQPLVFVWERHTDIW